MANPLLCAICQTTAPPKEIPCIMQSVTWWCNKVAQVKAKLLMRCSTPFRDSVFCGNMEISLPCTVNLSDLAQKNMEHHIFPHQDHRDSWCSSTSDGAELCSPLLLPPQFQAPCTDFQDLSTVGFILKSYLWLIKLYTDSRTEQRTLHSFLSGKTSLGYLVQTCRLCHSQGSVEPVSIPLFPPLSPVLATDLPLQWTVHPIKTPSLFLFELSEPKLSTF